MEYSVIAIIGNQKLNTIISQHLAKLDNYSLSFHTANPVQAASMLDNFSAQIIIIQEGLSFYSEDWFIHDTESKNPHLRYIVLKSSKMHDTISDSNKKLVSAILNWETLTPEILETALKTAAADYEKSCQTMTIAPNDKEWQDYYIQWIQKSNILAGVLNKTLDGHQLSWCESYPDSFILVIAENQIKPDFTFYNQSVLLMGKLYYQLNMLMKKLNGIVLISGEKKLCFLFSAQQNNKDDKLSVFHKTMKEITQNLQMPELHFSSSDIENDLRLLPMLYRAVDATLRYHFFVNQDIIITEHWLKKSSEKLVLEDFHIEIELLGTSFEQRDYHALIKSLNNIKHLTWSTLSFNSYSYVWGQLCFFYYSCAQKYGLTPEESFSNMNSQAFPDFEAAFSDISNYILLLFQALPDECQNTNNFHLKHAIEFIRKNITKNLTLTEVACATHVTPSYLSHLFRKELGTTYSNYYNQVRILYSAQLLHEPCKISQVAYELGFTDSKYFSKVFKRFMGESPKEYQLKIGGRRGNNNERNITE